MKKTKMFKDNGFKFVDNEAVRDELLEQGWKLEEVEGKVQDEKAELMAKAIEKGLNPHHALGVKKLKELLQE